jgi:hypothetical protein
VDYEHESLIFAVASEVFIRLNIFLRKIKIIHLISFIAMHIILVQFMIHVDHVLVVDVMIVNHVYGSMVDVHYHQIH